MINIDKIIQIESSGRPDVVSSKGAIGLMQITPICLKDYNKCNNAKLTMEDMKFPSLNIMVGAWYLNERIPQLLKSKNLPDCDFTRIIAYNAGVQRVEGIFDRLCVETENYLRKYFEVEVL